MCDEKDAEAALAGRLGVGLLVLIAEGDGVPKRSCDAGLSSGNMAGTTMSSCTGVVSDACCDWHACGDELSSSEGGQPSVGFEAPSLSDDTSVANVDELSSWSSSGSLGNLALSVLVWYRIKEKLTRRLSDCAGASLLLLSSLAHCVDVAIEALTLHMQLARIPSSKSRLLSVSTPLGTICGAESSSNLRSGSAGPCIIVWRSSL
mmetsp:Transcript_15811/g.45528  ORF Transcript_15811/g.45528 Transcript_15811/m.45528 type:complete len:205 (-) Transcript_15811:1100-1714(-)